MGVVRSVPHVLGVARVGLARVVLRICVSPAVWGKTQGRILSGDPALRLVRSLSGEYGQRGIAARLQPDSSLRKER